MFLRRIGLAGALTAVVAVAQMSMSVEQLMGFVRSSVKLRHPDKQVAEYLRKLALKEKLDDRSIELLLADGIGPKTAEALRGLRDASANLTPPPKAAPKPAPVVIPPPSSVEQAEILQKTSEQALQYEQNLPNFICTQVTRRFYDPAGLELWQSLDTVTAKLTYFDHKEQKQVAFVNNRYVDVSYDKLGGTTSTGEFGSLLRSVFERKSQTTYGWERWATLRGRLHYVFNYRVLRANSEWKIFYDKALETTPGYHGLIFVDKDYLTVSRITMNADEIPVDFPVQMARTQLDYDFTEISGQSFLLPLRSELRMRASKQLVKNEIEFRSYRKFGSDVQITFEPEPLGAEKMQETPVAPPGPAPKKSGTN